MGRFFCEDSRRLTGANLYSSCPGAVLDLVVKNETDNGEQLDQVGVDLDTVADSWIQHALALLDALSWTTERAFFRHYDNGISLGITAPIDCLYSAVDLAESALVLASTEFNLGLIPGVEVEIEPEFEAVVMYLKDSIRDENNPALVALATAADSHRAVFLYDDDVASLGTGAGCQQWPVDQIPDPAQINWDDISSAPLALITGTNGKSTSVRLWLRP